MKLPPTILIKDTDFASAWARAIRSVIREGIDITIGDTVAQKPIKDVCATIELTGNAIRQIEDRELHPQFPFRHVDAYCKEFTREYQEEYRGKPEREKFTYTYFDRFTDHFNSDQLYRMRWELRTSIEEGISSNRNQIVTWDPNIDTGSESQPCLQNLLIRYLGEQCIEVHWHFRSRDLYTAWQANIIGIVNMIKWEIADPNDCKIVKIVDYNDSLHIYESDMAAASNVKLVAKNPMGVH